MTEEMEGLGEAMAQISGQVHAAVNVCAFVVASDPNRLLLVQLIERLETHAVAATNHKPVQQAYVRGIRMAIATFREALKTAASAEQIRDLKTEGGH